MSTSAPDQKMERERRAVFNIPNQLTALRLVLAFVLFGLIEYRMWVAGLAVFTVAAFTDWLDGYLARLWNLGSTLGRNFDPLVDKVLICGAFVYLVPVDKSGIAPWMAVVVLARELIITSLRGYMETMGEVFGADMLGKIKMTLQCAALFAILMFLQWEEPVLKIIRDVSIYGMLVATALSGLQYLVRAFAMLRRPRP